jgi:hypothetical protein
MDDITETRMDILRRVTGVAALTAAGAMLAGLVWGFLIIQPVIDLIGADGIGIVGDVSFTLEAVASATVVVGAVLGWRLHRPVWVRGLLPTLGGLTLNWGWWLLDRNVDLWGVDRFLTEDGGPPSPELLQLGLIATSVIVAISLLAIGLVGYGGNQILRSPVLKSVPVAAS